MSTHETSLSLHTLGCKLNQAESEALAQQFLEQGFRVVDHGSAQVHVVNTCTVTHIADRKARHMLRFLRRNHPSAYIVATGCYAERCGLALSQAGADLVVDNGIKASLPQLLADQFKPHLSGLGDDGELSYGRRVRSFVKIQDGCSHFCSYCIVPLVRRQEFCIDADTIIREIQQRIELGYKEAVLTGTRIGSYSDGNLDLARLLKRILQETGIGRVHLSSLQPQEISAGLLKLLSDPRLVQHFHLPLQSGSQPVLERMGRRYSPGDYRRAVGAIRECVPLAAITTDIMAGFPGESEAEFEQSLTFCREMQFAALHVFAYSARPGTAAASMPGQVSEKVKKRRSHSLLELAGSSAADFRQKFLGTAAEVLFEGEESRSRGVYSGFSRHYIRVYAGGNIPLLNSTLKVKLTSTYGDGLWGEILT